MPISLLPSPHCICCPWKEAAYQEEVDTNLSKERPRRGGELRSGFIVCPSATLPSSPLSKLPRYTAARRCHIQTPKRIQRMEERTCVLFPLLCPSGQQTFHLTSAAATTAAAGRTHKLSIPLWSLLPLLPSSHFHSASDTHCSARLTNVGLGLTEGVAGHH